jgi:VanZ family protein
MPARPLRVVRPWQWWTGFVAVAAFALYLTFDAYHEGLPSIFQLPFFDKFAHFGFAGSLAFFLDGALKRRTLFSFGSALGKIAVPLAAVGVLVPSGLEEFAQRFTIHRTSSFADFAADIVGVVVLIPLSRRLAQ